MSSKDEIKMFIIQKREEGCTYQQVADLLFEEFGVVKSKQAICKQYQRETSKMEMSPDEIACFLDVIGLHAIGYTINNIKDILKSEGNSISTSRIKGIIEQNEGFIEDKISEYKDTVSQLYDCGADLDSIEKELTYKGYKPTEKRMKEFIYSAGEKRVLRSIKEAVYYMRFYDEEVYKKLSKKYTPKFRNNEKDDTQ